MGALVVCALAVFAPTACDDGGTTTNDDAAMQDMAADVTEDTGMLDTATPDMGGECGDDALDPGEVCDGTALDGATCETEGFDGGTLACNASCDGFDTSMCTSGPMCGNDMIEGDEVCDGVDLGGETCADQGFDGGGVVLCNDTCDGFVTTECAGSDACGNGEINANEVCDDDLLDGATCETEGFGGGGTLACSSDCDAYDTSGCMSLCGNGDVDAGEDCDGDNLGGAMCSDLGYPPGGTLACSMCSFDPSGCVPMTCGNDMLDAGEACDGTLLDGATCEGEGFDGGQIACSMCMLDTSGCTTCGDGTAEGDEDCDDTDLRNQMCASFGFDGGDLGCTVACEYDFSLCTGTAISSPMAPGDVVITEIMRDPEDNGGDSDAEYVEIHNPSSTITMELMGCRIDSNGNPGFAVMSSVEIAGGGYATFARSSTPGFTPDYVWGGTDVQFSNSSDDSVSITCDSTLIDEVAFGAGFPNPTGASLELKVSQTDATANDNGANWCESTGTFGTSTDAGTPGAENSCM